jgi:hypothetical protein
MKLVKYMLLTVAVVSAFLLVAYKIGLSQLNTRHHSEMVSISSDIIIETQTIGVPETLEKICAELASGDLESIVCKVWLITRVNEGEKMLKHCWELIDLPAKAAGMSAREYNDKHSQETRSIWENCKEPEDKRSNDEPQNADKNAIKICTQRFSEESAKAGVETKTYLSKHIAEISTCVESALSGDPQASVAVPPVTAIPVAPTAISAASLAVAPAPTMYIVDHDHRGIGHALGEESLRVAKAKGFIAMQFNYVVSTNAKAVALWQSLGFKIIGTMPQGYRHARHGLVDVYMMHRFLED